MSHFIPQANPKAAYLAHKEQLLDAVRNVLESGWYINGEQVRTFEHAFASFCSASHGIGVGNGTDAIELALRALGVTRESLVFTVSHTAVATVSAVERAGATPVLVDVEADHYTMSPASLEAALTAAKAGAYGPGKPAAIIPVHIYGQPADMDAILAIAARFGVPVIEDCAQAHGAQYKGRTVGSMGLMGTFSFYPTKNLGAFGDGGCVVTSDAALSHHMKVLREYGWEERYRSFHAGINTRLDELHAAMLAVRLPHLAAENEARRNIAAIYRKELAGLPGIILPKEREESRHVYHLFVVQVHRRDQFMAQLREDDIGTSIQYPEPVHMQPAYRGSIHLAPEGLPVTEALCTRIVSLPLYPELPEADARRVATAIRNILAA